MIRIAVVVLRAEVARGSQILRRVGDGIDQDRRVGMVVGNRYSAGNGNTQRAMLPFDDADLRGNLRQARLIVLRELHHRSQVRGLESCFQLVERFNELVDIIKGIIALWEAEFVGERLASSCDQEVAVKLLLDDSCLQVGEVDTGDVQLVSILDTLAVERYRQLLSSRSYAENLRNAIFRRSIQRAGMRHRAFR